MTIPDDIYNSILLEPPINHSITVGDHLHKRIEKHLCLLKYLENQSYTKQRWLISAFLEKIESENEMDFSSHKSKYLRFKLNKQLQEKIEGKINFIKKFRRSYSKKQWFIEAVHEKLEREEEKAKKLIHQLKELEKSQSK